MKRTLWFFAVFTVTIVAIGYALFKGFIQEGEPARSAGSPGSVVSKSTAKLAPDAETVSEDSPSDVRIESVEGLAEYRKPNREWEAVRAGDSLEENDSVKTAKNAFVEVKVDEKSKFRLDEQSELGVKRISKEAYLFTLESGKIDVDHHPSRSRLFQVRSGQDDTVAEARAGRFSIMKASGIVSVAATKGEVKLSAKKKTVVVGAGQQSIVTPGDEPRRPAPIPVSVLLQVAKPRRKLFKRFAVLTGRVSIGAQVRINDVPAETDAAGAFRVRVPLREGKNRLVAVTKDVAGNLKTEDLGEVIVESEAPVKDMQIEWD